MTHIILDTRESIKDFLAFLDEQSGLVAFDLETDSVSEIQANIYGVGLSLHSDEGYYIPIRNKNGEMFFGDKLTESLLRLLSNKLSGRKLIGHNIIYDVLVWKHSTGVDLTPNVHADTILMKHTIAEEPPFGLKELAVLEFGEGADLAQQELYENIKLNGGSTTKTNMQMFKADTEVLGKYACFAAKSARITMHDGSSKFIEDILIGDKVITHTGKIQKVYKSFNQVYNGKMYNLEMEGGRSTSNITSEHPFLVLNQETLQLEWKKIEDIKVNDLL